MLRAENPYLGLRDLNLPAVVRNLPPQPAIVTTYYPGVVDASSAGNIEADAGRVTGGIEIRMQNPPTFHIRGRISGAGFGNISVERRDGLVPSDNRFIFATAGGSFDIGGVIPGTYLISTRVLVKVSSANVDNLVVDAATCPKIRGTITLDGAPYSPKGWGLTLGHVGMSVGARDDGKGGLTFPCAAPSHYSIGMPPQPGIYVRSVALDGKDVTDSIDDLDLTSFADKTLNIALSSRAADVHGTVRDAAGKPLAGVPVSLWKFNGGYDATAESAPDGTFEFTNLAPGNYRAAAWNGLRPQPAGWGVQTVSEFRDAFETEVTHIMLGEDQHASVDPAVISRGAIEQAAERLKLNAITASPEEEAEIFAAVKSPETLAAYVTSHPTVDWKVVRKRLNHKEDQYWRAPCGSDFPAEASACATQIEAVSNPDQEILTISGGPLSRAIEHLRYLKGPGGGWRFAGEKNAVGHYSAGSHRLTQFGRKTFLVVSSDHSQNGIATQQVLEEWFDLTLPDFEPVFTFTPDGGQGRFGFGVGRGIKATPKLSDSDGVESIEVTLTITFDGVGLDLAATYTGVYQRAPGETKFTIRRATIPTQDFEELADPFSDLSNERLLAYALPGLEKIATGSDADAKDWLRSVLENAKDTPEKRTLLNLLSQH